MKTLVAVPMTTAGRDDRRRACAVMTAPRTTDSMPSMTWSSAVYADNGGFALAKAILIGKTHPAFQATGSHRPEERST